MLATEVIYGVNPTRTGALTGQCGKQLRRSRMLSYNNVPKGQLGDLRIMAVSKGQSSQLCRLARVLASQQWLS